MSIEREAPPLHPGNRHRRLRKARRLDRPFHLQDHTEFLMNLCSNLLSFAWLTSAILAQGETAPPKVRVAVYDVVASTPVEEAFLGLSCQEQQFTALTGHNGSTVVEGLQAPVGGAEISKAVTVEVHREGYVPFKTVAQVSQYSPRIYCPIVPLTAHYSTPAIKAASGGTFELEGLGRLQVQPNALAQDCRLRLIPMPMESWPDGLLEGPFGENVLCDHVWVSVVDPYGQPLPNSVIGSPTGVTLERTVPFIPGIPDGASQPVWTIHHLGENLDQTGTHVATVAKHTAEYPLAGGHNCLTTAYTVTSAGCVSFPWRIEYVYKSTRKEVMGCVSVSCGKYTANESARVGSGETRETTHSLDAEVAQEVGFEGSAGFAKIAGKSRLRIQGSFENTTTTTTMTERSVSVESGHNASNEEGADCTSALCCIGILYVTYEVWARQYTTCGAPATSNRKIGEIEVCVGLCVWFENVFWNPSCPGCAPEGSPAGLPGPGDFVF